MSAPVAKPSRLEVRLPLAGLCKLALKEGNRKKPIYEMHKWWARRLGSICRMLLVGATQHEDATDGALWKRFYEPGELGGLRVLDPFMGGGSSLVEARKLGARVVGVDIDPVAWFITNREIEPLPRTEFDAAVAAIEKTVGDRIRALYQTRVGRTEHEVIHFFWVEMLDCEECGHEFEGHTTLRLSYDEAENQQTVFCPLCSWMGTVPLSWKTVSCKGCEHVIEPEVGFVYSGRATCPECAHSWRPREEATLKEPIRKKLWAIEYVTKDGGRAFKRADDLDVKRYAACVRTFNKERDSLSYPRDPIPVKGRHSKRPLNHGYLRYEQLFNARQLLALAWLYGAIRSVANDSVRRSLLLAFSDALATNNMLCGYAFGYRRLTPLFAMHGYHVVGRPVEGNVWGAKHGRGSFLRCVEQVRRGTAYLAKPYEFKWVDGKRTQVEVTPAASAPTTTTTDVAKWLAKESDALLLNQSSGDLSVLPDGCIDLVLTDPPYYNNLAYSELADFYYVWLRPELERMLKKRLPAHTPMMTSFFVRDHERDGESFRRGLRATMRECARVLAPGGLLVFSYHHRHVAAWEALAFALAGAGFVVTQVMPVRSEGQSGFHSSPGSIKWDSVFCCRVATADIHVASDGPLTRDVLQGVSRWEKSLRPKAVPIGDCDFASLGMSLAVREVVNRKVAATELRRELDEVAVALNRRYPGMVLGEFESAPRAKQQRARRTR